MTEQSKTRSQPLSRERIELAALELIEREGLIAFSTRKLGAVLGCEAMSIYHHFPSKGHLLDALVDRVLKAATVSAVSSHKPMARLAAAARAFRQAALNYPQLFQYVAQHRRDSHAGARQRNEWLQIFLDAGVEPEFAARLCRLLTNYLIGALLEETAARADTPRASEPVQAEIISQEFPALAMAAPFFAPQYDEANFETGLALVLDAIVRVLGEHP